MGSLTTSKKPGLQRQFYTKQVRTPPQLKLCLGNEKQNRAFGQQYVFVGVAFWKQKPAGGRRRQIPSILRNPKFPKRRGFCFFYFCKAPSRTQQNTKTSPSALTFQYGSDGTCPESNSMWVVTRHPTFLDPSPYLLTGKIGIKSNEDIEIWCFELTPRPDSMKDGGNWS